MSNPPSPSPLKPTLRHRGLARAATLAEGPQPQIPPQRRNSTFSDSVSEARNTIRSSTDELLFPRASRDYDGGIRDEESHWHSAPLGLALLPAVAGIFFQNGIRRQNHLDDIAPPMGIDRSISPTHDNHEDGALADGDEEDGHHKERIAPQSTSAAAAEELQIHELAALASCFLFPLIGTWVLHTIRSNLSRPSEGLVSNYNLTIFLLAAEIRPFSHLLKMVQSRTLHLQRIIASSDDDEYGNKDKIDVGKIIDLSNRLEELEAHVAETAALRIASTANAEKEKETEKENRELTPQEQEYTFSLVSEAAAEYRKGFQADIDALNRAVRQYEKRTALTAYQTETRLQVLEAKTRDALSLAAAAQRSTTPRSRDLGLGLFDLLLDRTIKVILLPVEISVSVMSLPLVIARRGARVCRDMIFGSSSRSTRASSVMKKPSSSNRSGVSGGSDRHRHPRPRQCH
ncbi:uncharacterized protein BDW70DRAFT_170748 [Aspergillus foveolatus]|uniref:uncharacterized protein n=1 Tax=Aspergillus foveolatus TaxID=210207 RepID=UPI003CCCDB9E